MGVNGVNELPTRRKNKEKLGEPNVKNKTQATKSDDKFFVVKQGVNKKMLMAD